MKEETAKGRASMRNNPDPLWKYMSSEKKRCLVTGHKGYIGSHLYKTLKQLKHDVIGIDLKDGHDILQDLSGGATGEAFHPLYFNFKPEYIFHLACIPRVAYSIEEPVKTMTNNVLATTNVLNFARQVGAKRVIYSGSSSVVGDGTGPNSPYGLQKLISEMECKLYSKLYGLDTVTLRYFNVYSSDQKVNGPYSTAIAAFMDAIKSGKAPFITGDGTQRRDMLHVRDAVMANIFAMEHEGGFAGKNFDVGTGSNISLNEVKEIVNNYHPDIKFNYVDPREGDVLLTKADTKPINELGWKSHYNIYAGLRECFSQTRREI